MTQTFYTILSEFPRAIIDNAYLRYRYQMNPHKHIINRGVYSILEWLGDVGGFLEGSNLVAASILLFL